MDQLGKSRIGSDWIKDWFDIRVNHPPGTIVVGFLKLFERAFPVSESNINNCYVVRRNVFALRPFEEFIEDLYRLVAPAGFCVDMAKEDKAPEVRPTRLIVFRYCSIASLCIPFASYSVARSVNNPGWLGSKSSVF